MINNVSHTILTSTSGVKLSGSAMPKIVPPVNSMVNVNILDKLGSAYKILVDGSVFQTKLPFLAEIGDQILARVLNHKPFTLGVDNFALHKSIDNASLSAILLKLGLVDSEISKSVLKKVISGNKPLVKSKLKNLIEYLEENGLLFDELQLASLVNIFWSQSQEDSAQLLGSFDKIFDISFEELANSIYGYVETINSFAPSEIITERINSVVIFDPTKNSSRINIAAIKDKSKEFVYLVKLLEETENLGRIPYSISSSLESLKVLMLKYVLQKSLFNRYDTHPEFTIVKDNDSLELVIYKYDRFNIDGGELSYNISTLIHRNGVGEFVFNAYSTFDKITGDIVVSHNLLKIVHEQLLELNEKISKDYGIYSGIKVVPKDIYDNVSNDRPLNIKSIDTVA